MMSTDSTVNQSKSNTHKLVLNKQMHTVVHGDSPIGRFNARFALAITKGVGSMWCAYAFAILAFVSLPAVIMSGNPIMIVAWVAQTFLQLVLLPIIIVGQNVQAAATDVRAEADHETLTAIHALTSTVHTINEQQSVILNLLEQRTEPMQTQAPAP